MSRERVIRVSLWATVAFNALGAAVFVPVALGYQSELLPIPVTPFFAAQLGFVIVLFGGVYAWLARQPRINRPLLVVGALGKLGFFCLTLAYAWSGDIPMAMAINATPDLIFAGVFLWWARTAT